MIYDWTILALVCPTIPNAVHHDPFSFECGTFGTCIFVTDVKRLTSAASCFVYVRTPNRTPTTCTSHTRKKRFSRPQATRSARRDKRPEETRDTVTQMKPSSSRGFRAAFTVDKLRAWYCIDPSAGRSVHAIDYNRRVKNLNVHRNGAYPAAPAAVPSVLPQTCGMIPISRWLQRSSFCHFWISDLISWDFIPSSDIISITLPKGREWNEGVRVV